MHDLLALCHILNLSWRINVSRQSNRVDWMRFVAIQGETAHIDHIDVIERKAAPEMRKTFLDGGGKFQ